MLGRPDPAEFTGMVPYDGTVPVLLFHRREYGIIILSFSAGDESDR